MIAARRNNMNGNDSKRGLNKINKEARNEESKLQAYFENDEQNRKKEEMKFVINFALKQMNEHRNEE